MVTRSAWMCVAVALLVGAGGCSAGDATGSDAGSGGTPGSGGATGSGGTPGTGGAAGTGGATGSGGAAGTAGATGSGGAGVDAATDPGTGPSADAGAGPTFTEIFNSVLNQGCANGYCHGAGVGGVNVTSKEKAYATLVPAKVIANNPDGSILIQRLTTTNTTQRMPTGGGPLSAAQIEKVRAWILAGAPNN